MYLRMHHYCFNLTKYILVKVYMMKLLIVICLTTGLQNSLMDILLFSFGYHDDSCCGHFYMSSSANNRYKLSGALQINSKNNKARAIRPEFLELRHFLVV